MRLPIYARLFRSLQLRHFPNCLQENALIMTIFFSRSCVIPYACIIILYTYIIYTHRTLISVPRFAMSQRMQVGKVEFTRKNSQNARKNQLRRIYRSIIIIASKPASAYTIFFAFFLSRERERRVSKRAHLRNYASRCR